MWKKHARGVHGLSFVDDLARWVDGKSEEEVGKGGGSDAGLGWARENGVTFDRANAEAMFLSKRRKRLRGQFELEGTEFPSTNIPRGGSESGSTPRRPSRSTTPRG